MDARGAGERVRLQFSLAGPIVWGTGINKAQSLGSVGRIQLTFFSKGFYTK